VGHIRWMHWHVVRIVVRMHISVLICFVFHLIRPRVSIISCLRIFFGLLFSEKIIRIS
jgi:hypothetical protein